MKALRLLCVRSTIALMITLLTFGDVSWTQAQTTQQVSPSFPAPPPGPSPGNRERGGGSYLLLPAPPPGLPPRNRQRGGGSRSIESCSAAKPDLAALVPSYPLQKQLAKQPQNTTKSIVWGKTSVEHPSFWFYTPYTRSNYRAQFSLIDLETGLPYPTETADLLPTEAGIFQISSPASLAVGKRYRWNLKIFCNAKTTQTTIGAQSLTEVDGVVERVSLDAGVTSKLQTATDSIRLDIYVEQELWFDALTTLITLQQKNPSAWSGTWKDWLETIGLGDIAEKPLAK